jgi:protein-S-isoprenylcysteine O-methyltransferase Ste14
MPVLPPFIRELYTSWGKEWACAINAGVFLLFILFIPYRKKVEWRSKGVFSAFILALMAEMFGIPFLFYILYPFLGYSMPVIHIPGVGSLQISKHFFMLGWPGALLGTYMTAVGMVLVFVGWTHIYRADGLVTTGLYRYVRHPQYTGLSLIVIGWIFHWGTLVTGVMCIILVVMYYRLARQEEKELIEQYKDKYQDYVNRTPMVFPIRIPKIHNHGWK